MAHAAPRRLAYAIEAWPLARPFRIARGSKTEAVVIAVEVAAAGRRGRGEGVPYARYGESPASVGAQVESVRDAIEAGVERAALAALLPPGAARNALDCALWDLAGDAPAAPAAMATALTVGIDAPAAMAAAAAALAGSLVKVKVDADDPLARIAAVRHARPDARLIVDPNESWTPDLLASLQDGLAALAVALVEQPLPAAADAALDGLARRVPLAADESVHTAADLPRLAGRYDVVNIKLDKAGGLTAALELEAAARAAGFGVMAGCMICTSLAIAPLLPIAARADFVDLDGPWWLAEDRPGGVRVEGGLLHAPTPGFWGAA